MDVEEAAAWLRERADSYFRDARTLEDDGDHPMAEAFRAAAADLRQCADQLSAREGVTSGNA